MEPVILYRLLDAVRDSLARAGRTDYALYRAQNHEVWLDLAWFQDYASEVEIEALPLIWDGRALPPHDTIRLLTRSRERELWRTDHTGAILLCDDALVCAVTLMPGDGSEGTYIILGERSEGAMQRLVDAFGAYTRTRSRTSSWITVIGGDPLPRPRGLDWDALILPPGFREDLRRQVSSFFDQRPAYGRLGIPHRRGLLFTGPPGNGKTSALRLIASDRDEPFITYTMTDETRRHEIDQAFDKAALDAPSILCFEDVDSLFLGNHGLSHFLNRIDGIHPLEGVLLLATTNHPEQLDAALTERPSRFDRVFHFGNPKPDERRRYLRDGFGPAFEERLVVQSEGFSMAQLKEVRVSACLEAIQAGLPGPTAAAGIAAIERMRGQKTIVRDLEPERTIAGFTYSRSCNDGKPSA